ncbi:MAG: serine hydrolase domain-containing protein [Candidatus Dormibacteria bacterium]
MNDRVATGAKRLRIPGVSAGVEVEGHRIYAHHGVTSLDNPLPVDARTLFQVGSNTKTFTGTVIMRLVEMGKLDLGAPVRKYLPELRLQDKRVLGKVTVRQLLNHTAGWAGDAFMETGDGDDALARYVEHMESVPQESQPGEIVSYNNPSFSLLGRIIEKLTGRVFEAAVREMVIEPLRLDDTLFPPHGAFTRRFAVGHLVRPQTVETANGWLIPRSCSAAGTLLSTPTDMLRYARFHMHGDAPRGARVLSARSRRQMREVTARCPGSALGDAIGTTWLLQDLDGVAQVGHGGGTNGQISLFQTVPERGFAVVVLTNASVGGELNTEIMEWATEACLGIKPVRPRLNPVDPGDRGEYVGRYASAGVVVEVTQKDEALVASPEFTPLGLQWARAFAGEQAEKGLPPPFQFEILEGDRFRVAGGVRSAGVFVREHGRIKGVSVNGRVILRDPANHD